MSYSNNAQQFRGSRVKQYIFLEVWSHQECFKEKEIKISEKTYEF